jgi:hypothetical protein
MRENLLFEVLENDGTLVEGPRRITIESETWDETFGRNLKKVGRFLVWINFICIEDQAKNFTPMKDKSAYSTTGDHQHAACST